VATNGRDTRARIMMRRCFGGSIYVVTASLPWDNWPYDITYGKIHHGITSRCHLPVCLSVLGPGAGDAAYRERPADQTRSHMQSESAFSCTPTM
jgi:hypothetical protein